jgi:hypothetical protein
MDRIVLRDVTCAGKPRTADVARVRLGLGVRPHVLYSGDPVGDFLPAKTAEEDPPPVVRRNAHPHVTVVQL